MCSGYQTIIFAKNQIGALLESIINPFLVTHV